MSLEEYYRKTIQYSSRLVTNGLDPIRQAKQRVEVLKTPYPETAAMLEKLLDRQKGRVFFHKDEQGLLLDGRRYYFVQRNENGVINIHLSDELLLAKNVTDPTSFLQQIFVRILVTEYLPLQVNEIDAIVRLFNSETTKKEKLSDLLRFDLDQALNLTSKDPQSKKVETWIRSVMENQDPQGICPCFCRRYEKKDNWFYW